MTDMNMPGRSGMEFVRDMKARFPELSILILSMNGEDLHAERALKARSRKGFTCQDDRWVKPAALSGVL
jgi:DNA-binding NarL/FixJ family response regulator